MSSIKHTGISLLVILALMVSMLAVLAPATPVQAAATSAIINQPTTDNVTLTKGTGGSVTVKYYLIGTGVAETVHIYITNGTTNIFDSGNLSRTSDNTTLHSEICAINAASAGNYYLNIYVNSVLLTSQTGTTTVIVDNTAPTVSVTLPNASTCGKGAIGQIIALQWSATDAASTDNVTVSADLSIDGGANYTVSILSSISYLQGAQLYNHTIAGLAINSSICKIRLKAIDRAGNDSSYMYSSLFSVLDTAPTATVSSPAGGETWNGASSQTITGTLTGSGTTLTYMIELLKAGVNTENITSSWQTATLSGGVYSISYPWTVTNSDRGSTFTVGIYARDCAGNISTLGTSAATFTIKDITPPTVTVTAPATGAIWYSPSTSTIGWTQTDNVPGSLTTTLYYSTDGGANWLLITSGSYAQGANTYAWTVPSIPTSTNCKIKITAADIESPANTGTGYSGTFTINTCATTPSVTVCSPNGGESWTGTATQSITWTASDSPDATARMTYTISYSTDGGATYPNLIATLTNQAQCSSCTCTYYWALPNITNTQYKVRIIATDPCGNTATDYSNAVFSITATTCLVDTVNVTLTSGWNLISLPESPTNTNIDSILSDVMGNVTSVWYYSGGASGTWYSYAPGAPSTLLTLEAGKAYWFNMATGDTLSFQGRKCPCPPASPPTFTVTTTGWNMIGFKSTVGNAVSTYFASLGTCGTAYLAPINGYTSGAWTTVNCSDNMTPGMGYWVYINTTGTIVPGCE